MNSPGNGGSAPASERGWRGPEHRSLIAFLATLAFALIELAGGLFSGSLALLADALHMFADGLALAMTWAAFRLGRMAPDAKRSYGYHRWEVLAALANGVSLVFLSLWIAIEGVLRLFHPHPVEGRVMLVVATLGLVANFAVFRILGGQHHDHHAGHDHHEHHERNLNLEGAVLHVLGDLLGSVAAMAGAVVILLWGWTTIDPILSIIAALVILGGALRLSRQATHILLEGVPEGFDAADFGRRLKDALPVLRDIHHVHAWSLGSGQRALTLHVVVDPSADRDAVLGSVKKVLAEEMGFPHSVVQVEGVECGDRGSCPPS